MEWTGPLPQGQPWSHCTVLSHPCSAVTGLPPELPFPSPHLIAKRQKLISLWHKLILMSPVPSDSSQTSQGALQGRAGSHMTYGPCSPRRPAAPDDSGHLQPPPKSAVMEQPGELPSLSSDSAGAPGRRLPGQGAQAVRKWVTSSRLTHPSATWDGLREGGSGSALQL